MSVQQAEINSVTLSETANDEDVVTPWDVSSNNDTGIDYDKLISEFDDNILYTALRTKDTFATLPKATVSL